jgi:hypothetical protein
MIATFTNRCPVNRVRRRRAPPALILRIVTAKEQLRRRIDDLSEAEAIEALRALERQAEDAGDRLDALLDSAPPEDYDDDALTQEARDQAARGDVNSHQRVRRELLGS